MVFDTASRRARLDGHRRIPGRVWDSVRRRVRLRARDRRPRRLSAGLTPRGGGGCSSGTIATYFVLPRNWYLATSSPMNPMKLPLVFCPRRRVRLPPGGGGSRVVVPHPGDVPVRGLPHVPDSQHGGRHRRDFTADDQTAPACEARTDNHWLWSRRRSAPAFAIW